MGAARRMALGLSAKIIGIKRQIRDQGLAPEQASKLLNKLESDLSGTFPGVNTPTDAEK